MTYEAGHPVTVTVSGCRDGAALRAAASLPIAFSGWRIKAPGGFGFLGPLANHGPMEFRLARLSSDNRGRGDGRVR